MNRTTNRETGERGAIMASIICTTCGQAPEAPYRRTVAGVVTEGCVSAAHDGHADGWHLRPQAAAIRSTPKAWADTAPVN